jgi:hypothetical protein
LAIIVALRLTPWYDFPMETWGATPTATPAPWKTASDCPRATLVAVPCAWAVDCAVEVVSAWPVAREPPTIVVSATEVEWDSVCEENPPELSATVVAELTVWEVPSATPQEWLSV